MAAALVYAYTSYLHGKMYYYHQRMEADLAEPIIKRIYVHLDGLAG